MIHYLLLFQFPLLYCITIALGLVVYGSDFDELAGKLYLVPLFLLPILHWFVAKLIKPLSSTLLVSILMILGAVVALLAYQELHFAYWDEHSLTQTTTLVMLGILSYLSSVVASLRLQAWQGNHRIACASAWLVLGLCWMLAFYFPMSSLLVMAAIMAVASLWSVVDANQLQLVQYKKTPELRPMKYLVFVLAIDMSLVVWDYQVNTGWAWHLSGAFIVGALGSWLAFNSLSKYFWLVMFIATANFLAAVIWPTYILHYMHSSLVGLCLGWSIACLITSRSSLSPILVVSSAMPLFLGLAFGNLFYANLAHVHWRIVFLLPLLVLLFVKFSNGKAGVIETANK